MSIDPKRGIIIRTLIKVQPWLFRWLSGWYFIESADSYLTTIIPHISPTEISIGLAACL